MKQKRTTAAEAAMDVSIRVVLLTLDNHVSAALESAFVKLRGVIPCLLYTSPSPRDVEESRMPSSA